MKLKFQNRIALFNTIAAAGSTLIVFLVVYFVVSVAVFRHLESDILTEKAEVFENLQWNGDSLTVKLSPEWEEVEHRLSASSNPTFLQISDQNGRVIFYSGNLKKGHLPSDHTALQAHYSDHIFNQIPIRQGQFPVLSQKGEIVGQVNIGVSKSESELVLKNLRLTLLIAFPLLVLIFYAATSFAAARGIAPVRDLIQTVTQIDDRNLSERLTLPAYKDEIHQLAATINDLLNRLENSLQREKQVVADISHELRTPLAAIRGTLEVLLRKQREPAHYEQKIEQVIVETDRMYRLLEQLLQLARLESGNIPVSKKSIHLNPLLQEIQQKWQPPCDEKQAVFSLNIPQNTVIQADPVLFELIISNLISNALKYGQNGVQIDCQWDDRQQALLFSDNGPGIPANYLPFIFDRFYRTDDSRNTRIPGAGLGLSIVKRMVDLQQMNITVSSTEGAGTAFRLSFTGK